MGSRLILYDTSNYEDYPVGGQMTSIRNFLRYMAEEHENHAEDILLVGISRNALDLGKKGTVSIGGVSFPFLPVAQAPEDLASVKHSLRGEFLKGILKYRKEIGIRKEDCNYIHTPEAFLAIKLIRPGASCCVFSHGTYVNMWKRVRFFRKFPLVRRLFQMYLMSVIRGCKKVFVLDKACQRDYAPYNQNVILVGNTIVCRPFLERGLHDPVRLLYAGRLSGEKNVGPIVEAAKTYGKDCVLTLLGEGEERSALEDIAGNSSRIVFKGAVNPMEVQEEMRRQDILILNSVSEGIPMVILEALCNSMPVITTNVGGIPEVLTYGEDSEATDGTAQSIQKAVDAISTNYEQYVQAAYQKSLSYDYRKGNGRIFEKLNEELGW